MAPDLYIIVPCYNEEEALPRTAQALREVLRRAQEEGLASTGSRIVPVDDGSRDRTWEIIRELAKDPAFGGIRLAHNSGHMNALLAGLTCCVDECDCTVTIDADLQDDPEAILSFLREYANGHDVVLGVRASRRTDGFFKRFTAHAFYSLMKAMGVETVYDHADYRLLSRRAGKALLNYTETNLYLRGIVPLLGFRPVTVPFDRSKRVAGESKYPLSRMVKLALDGITGFSLKPLRLIALAGLAVLAAGIVLLCVKGVSFAAASVWTVGGLILCALGLIAEYTGRIYMETKRRPRFTVEEKL